MTQNWVRATSYDPVVVPSAQCTLALFWEVLKCQKWLHVRTVQPLNSQEGSFLKKSHWASGCTLETETLLH